MKSVKLISERFDGAAFAALYGLTPLEYHVNGDVLFFPDTLPDNPVQTECAPLSAVVTPAASIAAIKTGQGTLADVLAVVSWALRTGRLS